MLVEDALSATQVLKDYHLLNESGGGREAEARNHKRRGEGKEVVCSVLSYSLNSISLWKQKNPKLNLMLHRYN